MLAALRAATPDRNARPAASSSQATSGWRTSSELGEPHPLNVEQSNVSTAFGDKLILKTYRRLRSGVQPEVEMARFLTEEAGFDNTPAFLGSIEHRPADGGEPTLLAAAFAYVLNQGDAWGVITNALHRDLEEHAMLGRAQRGTADRGGSRPSRSS